LEFTISLVKPFLNTESVQKALLVLSFSDWH